MTDHKTTTYRKSELDRPIYTTQRGPPWTKQQGTKKISRKVLTDDKRVPIAAAWSVPLLLPYSIHSYRTKKMNKRC